MSTAPTYLTLFFIGIVIVTITWFYLACRSKTFLLVTVCWIVIQSALALGGFYENEMMIPPRLALFGVFPALLAIVILTARGGTFIDRINLKTLTAFHSIRVLVEIVLALLSVHMLVSPYMTYEKTNFDILSGMSAIPVAYLAFRTGRVNKKLLLLWNVVCLVLLLNVVIIAVLALPSPFQRISLDQPNVAVLYFPFNLLPTVIVPLVFFAHLIAFRRLNRKTF